jgi:hypothetical protein
VDLQFIEQGACGYVLKLAGGRAPIPVLRQFDREPSPVPVRMILDQPANPGQIPLAYRSGIDDLRLNHAPTLRVWAGRIQNKIQLFAVFFNPSRASGRLPATAGHTLLAYHSGILIDY